MDGVAIVEDESGGNGHPECSEAADGPAEKRPEEEDPENGDQTCQNHRKT
jgi:hypothetical protein